jgi:peptidoglycan hydrolase-like protein with peptidoglycan-binding domain
MSKTKAIQELGEMAVEGAGRRSARVVDTVGDVGSEYASHYSRRAYDEWAARVTPGSAGYTRTAQTTVDPYNFLVNEIDAYPVIKQQLRNVDEDAMFEEWMAARDMGLLEDFYTVEGRIDADSGHFMANGWDTDGTGQVPQSLLDMYFAARHNRDYPDEVPIRVPVGFRQTNGVWGPDTELPRYINYPMSDSPSQYNQSGFHELHGFSNNARRPRAVENQEDLFLSPYTGVPETDEEAQAIIELLWNDEFLAMHSDDRFSANWSGVYSDVESGQGTGARQTARHVIEEVQERGFDPKEVAAVRQLMNDSLTEVNYIWNNLGEIDARQLEELDNLDTPWIRGLINPLDPQAGRPIVIYRMDSSPLLPDGRQLAQVASLEGGHHWGPTAVARHFVGGHDSAKLANNAVSTRNAMAESLPKAILDEVGDETLSKQTQQVIANYMADNPPRWDKSLKEGKFYVDMDAAMGHIDHTELEKLIAETGVPRDSASSIASTAIMVAKQQRESILYASVITGKKPLILADNMSFTPPNIIAQITERDEFYEYTDELWELNRQLRDPENPLFKESFERMWDIIEEVGYDPFIAYANRAEPRRANTAVGGGVPSFIFRPGAEDRVMKRVYRTDMEERHPFFNAHLTNAAIGLPVATGGSIGIDTITNKAEAGVSTTEIIDTIIRNEGGFQNDPADSGNIVDGKVIGTNYGITPKALADYRGVPANSITEKDIRDLREEEARAIYQREYITRPKIDQLPPEIQANVADMGVNAGPKRAVKILQKMLGVTADGIIGPETIEAAKKATSDKYSDARDKYYESIAKGDKEKFLKGWLRRSDKFRGKIDV